jgi:hypothetical protein
VRTHVRCLVEKYFPPFSVSIAVYCLGFNKGGKKSGPPFFHPFSSGSQYPCHPFSTLFEMTYTIYFPPFFLSRGVEGYMGRYLAVLYILTRIKGWKVLCYHPFGSKMRRKLLNFPPFRVKRWKVCFHPFSNVHKPIRIACKL